MYDHIKLGWTAISFVVMGFMFVGLALAFFMLGDQPLGLRFFRRKNQTPQDQTSEEHTPEEKTPKEGLTATLQA